MMSLSIKYKSGPELPDHKRESNRFKGGRFAFQLIGTSKLLK
jgi:hypothetical protein